MRFLTRFFAVIGFLVVLLAALGGYLFTRSEQPESEPDTVALVLDFDQPVVEQNEPSPLDLATNDQPVSLLDMLRAINKAKDDPHVKALVGRFGGAQPSLAHAQEIMAAIKSFRAAGKMTLAFGTDIGEYGMGNRAYYLASAFENIWLQPVGTVGLSGLAVQSPFGKSALAKLGITADFMQREEFKSFMDMGTRDDFAPPVRANMQSLLDDMAEQEAAAIAENRGFDKAHVKDLMAKGPYTDDEAVKEKLVSRLGYSDEVDDLIKEKSGKDVKFAGVDDYLGYAAEKKDAKAKIALIYGAGMIMDHAGPGGLTGEKVMGADTVAQAFDDAADDKDIKAILFRVDSPGGSPEASETIRRAMIHAQKLGKPVYVSMGETAASGGYWIAMNGDRILADPGTITGSIGVLAGKFTVGGLLEKLGVKVGTIKTADNAGMWSVAENFTPAQRERMNVLLDNSYKAFTQNVAAARKIPLEKMPDIAKGRVWTGAQAAKIGLVDELGGFDATVLALRKKLNLAENDPVTLVPFPTPETSVERVMKLLKTFGVEEAMAGRLLTQWRDVLAVVGGVVSGHVPLTARISPAFQGMGGI